MDTLAKPAAGAKASTWKWNANMFSENLTPADKASPAIYQAVWPLERGMENATQPKPSAEKGKHRGGGKKTARRVIQRIG